MADLTGRGPLGLKQPKPTKEQLIRAKINRAIERRRTAKPQKRPPAAKSKPKADRQHLAKVAALPCVICASWPVHVHHCISGRYGQRKAPDSDTIPLCPDCHQGPEGIHASKRAWEERHGPDTGFLPLVKKLIEAL